MSPRFCAQLCADKGYAVSGTETIACFCGQQVRSTAKPLPQTAAACARPCPGYPEFVCGGRWAVQVMSVNCSGAPEPTPPKVPYLNNPCRAGGAKASLPFCNAALPVDDRVADAVGRMTLQEKVDAMSTSTAEIPSLGLGHYDWWSEGAHGISHVRWDAETPAATNFALTITAAASFNRSMWAATAAAISEEARAFMNAGGALRPPCGRVRVTPGAG